MKNANRIAKVVLAALIASIPSACAREQGEVKPPAEIQSDSEPSRTAGAQTSNGQIRLQESSPFPVDEKQKPFAMIDDRADKVRAGDGPRRIDEQRPRR